MKQKDITCESKHNNSNSAQLKKLLGRRVKAWQKIVWMSKVEFPSHGVTWPQIILSLILKITRYDPNKGSVWGGEQIRKVMPWHGSDQLDGVQRLAPKKTHDQKAKEVNQPGGNTDALRYSRRECAGKKVRRANKSLMHGSLFLQWTLPYVRGIFPPFWFYQCYFWKSSPRDLLKGGRERGYVYIKEREGFERKILAVLCA